MSATPSHVYQAVMGFSHRELIRGLPSAVEPYVVSSISADCYTASCENRIAKIHLGPENTRQIASLKLPKTGVTVEFEGFSDIQYSEFLERFKKYLHRGGG